MELRELTMCLLVAMSLVGCATTQMSQDEREASKLTAENHQRREDLVRDSLQKIGEHERTGKFIQAAKAGDIDIVKALIREGQEVDNRDSDGMSALLAASANGRTQVVSLLLENGASLAIEDSLHQNALKRASFSGNVQIVELLLKKGLESGTSSQEIRDLLRETKKRGRPEVVRVLEKYEKKILAAEKKEQDERKKAEAAERRRIQNLPKYIVKPFGSGKYGEPLTGYAMGVETCEKWVRNYYAGSNVGLAMMLSQGEITLLPSQIRVRVLEVLSIPGVGMNAGRIFYVDKNRREVYGYVPAIFLEQLNE